MRQGSTLLNMSTAPPTIVDALASIYIQRATAELNLKNQEPPITYDEFNFLYAFIAVGLKRLKHSSNVDRLLAQQLWDRYVDDCLVPFLCLNTSAKEAATKIRCKIGRFYNVAGLSRISKLRKAHIEKLASSLGETVTNGTAVLTMIWELPNETLKPVFRGAQECVLANNSLQDDIKRRSLKLWLCTTI